MNTYIGTPPFLAKIPKREKQKKALCIPKNEIYHMEFPFINHISSFINISHCSRTNTTLSSSTSNIILHAGVFFI
jgi:hypothetical protein